MASALPQLECCMCLNAGIADESVLWDTNWWEVFKNAGVEISGSGKHKIQGPEDYGFLVYFWGSGF